MCSRVIDVRDETENGELYWTLPSATELAKRNVIKEKNQLLNCYKSSSSSVIVAVQGVGGIESEAAKNVESYPISVLLIV